MTSALVLPMICARCVGRGWIHREARSYRQNNLSPCGCKRYPAVFDERSLGRALRMHPRSIVNVWEGRARASTCARVLSRLRKLLYFTT